MALSIPSSFGDFFVHYRPVCHFFEDNRERDLMNKVEIPAVKGVFDEPWSFKKILGLLAIFGPAAIVASVAIGAGETIVVVRAGAWAGYDLLWLVFLSCIVKAVFVTYLLGRYTAISGEYIGHRLVHLPGPRGWFLIALLIFEMIGAPLAWVPISKPCGDLCLPGVCAEKARINQNSTFGTIRFSFSFFWLFQYCHDICMFWHPPLLK